MRLKHVETGPLRLIRGQDTSRTPGLLGAERHYRSGKDDPSENSAQMSLHGPVA
jgi:hypothetical protein